MDKDDRHNPYPNLYSLEELVSLDTIQDYIGYIEYIPIRYFLEYIATCS